VLRAAVFLLKIVCELNFCSVTCHFMDMNDVNKATFNHPSLAIRSQRRTHRRGQTLVEYALILAIISVVVIGVIINLGKAITGVYSSIDSTIASAQASH
jgi:Flp pilus assembly pilin Flp